MARDIRRGDEERRRKCVRFGVSSIIFAILAVPFAFLAMLSIGWMKGDAALLAIFIIALLAVSIGGALIMLFNAILYFILQLTVNRKPVTWIALVFLAASIAACLLICLKINAM